MRRVDKDGSDGAGAANDCEVRVGRSDRHGWRGRPASLGRRWPAAPGPR